MARLDPIANGLVQEPHAF